MVRKWGQGALLATFQSHYTDDHLLGPGVQEDLGNHSLIVALLKRNNVEKDHNCEVIL